MELNITLVSILVIVLLFMPGFFFKRFYYSGQFTKQFYSGTFAERFITSVFWGIMVQLVALISLGKLTKFKYSEIRNGLTAFYSELQHDTLPECNAENFYYGAGYVLFCIVTAAALGWLLHNIVRVLRMDVYFPVLRFSNYWNYYLRGDLSELRSANKKGKWISTNIDAIVDDGSGNTKLYSGFLAHYTISPTTGELETVALTSVERWSGSQSVFKPIKGDNLIIPFKTIVNLNLRYTFKQVSWKMRYLNFLSLVIFLMLPMMAFYIVRTYVDTLNVWRIIGAVMFSSLALILAFTALAYPVTPTYQRATSNVRRYVIGYAVTMFLLFVGVTYLCLGGF